MIDQETKKKAVEQAARFTLDDVKGYLQDKVDGDRALAIAKQFHEAFPDLTAAELGAGACMLLMMMLSGGIIALAEAQTEAPN